MRTSGQCVQLLTKGRNRRYANDFVDELAIGEEHQRGKALNALLRRQQVLFVRVNFHELDAPPYSLASSSRIGVSILHGGHPVA